MFDKIDFDSIDFRKTPPAEEPQRQYYFIAKARELIREESKRLGRPLFFKSVTFGCQMNARDSEKLVGILEAVGYEPAEEYADFVIYNTCTVRDNANQRVYGRLGVLNGYKRKNPHMKIALCGCMMQEASVIDKIRKSYGFVDLIFGTHNIFKFAELLVAVLEKPGDMIVDIWQDTDKIVEDLPVERKYPFKSGINIMFGCNNFCSYCIVPYVRGRERSREPNEIVREIEELVSDGVVEVMLLGQNVNSYGKNLSQPITFAQLLLEVEKIEGLKRIRFMTSHPKDLSDELIQVMKYSKKICKHLHLPLQSGSSRILEAMNRRYTKEQYLELAEKIRREIPDISITTDIIVGFPGETKEDIEETIDVIRKVQYENAYTFIYSKRTGTPAAAMEKQVPEALVKEGFDKVLKTVQGMARERVKRMEGQITEVLAEELNEQEEGLITGRMSNNTLVHFPGGKELIGQLIKVRLDECKGFYYMGSRV